MNYYERFCGDYARDTGHLSLQEHGAYTVMLDTYYATETALPADYKALYRICRAMNAREQESVRSVADQFFKVGVDGLRHNPKADEIIAKAMKRIDAAKTNGERGGRPKKEPGGFQNNNPVGLAEEPSGLPSGHIGTTTNPRPHVPKDQKLVGSAPNGARHAPDDSEILITLPLRTGGDFEVRRSLVAELEPLCPAVDVPLTLTEMKLWLVGNPDRRKTPKGIRRFITNWLKTEQEKHGRQD